MISPTRRERQHHLGLVPERRPVEQVHAVTTSCTRAARTSTRPVSTGSTRTERNRSRGSSDPATRSFSSSRRRSRLVIQPDGLGRRRIRQSRLDQDALSTQLPSSFPRVKALGVVQLADLREELEVVGLADRILPRRSGRLSVGDRLAVRVPPEVASGICPRGRRSPRPDRYAPSAPAERPGSIAEALPSREHEIPWSPSPDSSDQNGFRLHQPP